MYENYNSEYIGRMGLSRIYKIEKEEKELYFTVRLLVDPSYFVGEVTIDFENNNIKKGDYEIMKIQYLDDNKIKIIKNGPVDKEKEGAIFPSEMPFKLPPIIDGYYFTREAVDEVKLAAGDSNKRLAKLLGKDAVQQFLFKSKTKKSKSKTKTKKSKSKTKKSKTKKSKSKKSKKSKSKNL